MSSELVCYRCGESVESLTLPLSRRDQCPVCSADLHVCKMCKHYDRNVPRQCREDGAEDVKEKDRPNFCDWFAPMPGRFDAGRKAESDAAQAALDSLFGDDE